MAESFDSFGEEASVIDVLPGTGAFDYWGDGAPVIASGTDTGAEGGDYTHRRMFVTTT
jgi:hypothetical protein